MAYDLGASKLVGKDYGIVKEYEDGNLMNVAKQGVKDFTNGYIAHKKANGDNNSGNKTSNVGN